MTQRTLVTGGAGFLGSHLCERLVERGEHVICLDNLFTGRRETIAHLEDNSNFEFVLHDVMEPIDIEVDAIYNLACPAAPGHYQHNPVNTTMTSILGAVHTLELAKKCNAKLFHSSTSEVYGDPTVHPQPESYRGNVNPIGLRACYDEGKRAAESIMFDYHRMHGVDIRVVRIFNTYGPHMHPFDGRVVSNFIRQALAGENLTIFGDGLQSRSFCYVEDLINGFLAMMDADEATGPINLGNPGEFTMLELASLVLELTNGDSELIMQPLPADDPTQRQPDISLAKSTLQWEPTIPLAEGLKRTIDWFSEIDLSQWTPPTPNWGGGLTDE
ncbi:MAG: SDR family oxidoreductase [Phycisphaerae bacterium]|jgi:UDP-glucuronate decarboxylase|nr:SDR family oxidoreductase [Phycisphaerae bacterium]